MKMMIPLLSTTHSRCASKAATYVKDAGCLFQRKFQAIGGSFLKCCTDIISEGCLE